MRATTSKIYDMTLPIIIDGDETYWPMRAISEAIGISWHSQIAKLQPPRYTPHVLDVRIPGQANAAAHTCLAKNEFEFWLKTLNPRKISPEARHRLSQLRRHFFGEPPVQQTSITPSAKIMDSELAPAAVLSRMVAWKVQQQPNSARSATEGKITRKFATANGYPISQAGCSQLAAAVSSLSTIIAQMDSPSSIGNLSISERVDTFISGLVTNAKVGKPTVSDANLAGLICAVELEQRLRAASPS